MPRTARASVGGYCYHVVNWGNAQSEVFHEAADFEAFLTAAARVAVGAPMRVLAYCLMPNHFHLVVWPREDGDLSRWMHRLMTSHVRRHLGRRQADGHVWRGRFKAFPIQEDQHLLRVIRHVERNALRAGLVDRAEAWPWSSLNPIADGPPLDPGPVPRGADWLKFVNDPATEAELAAIRLAIKRDRPYGSDDWTTRAASRLGLESSLRPRGRPRKQQPG